MNTKLMNGSDVLKASYNIDQIEKCLGRPIPNGYFDPTEYSDRLLTGGEAFTIANNIERTEKYHNKTSPYRYSNAPALDDNTAVLSGLAALVFLLIKGIISLVKLLCKNEEKES